ncbi:MAG TPA: hypothetical protein VFU19_14180 [Iamia sp.]|nr:hypothetical protein [Iamia sp.]
MSDPLWVQLLDQADRLADPEGVAPSEADLRRAASAAYYAVFHRLTHLMATGVGADLETAAREGLRRVPQHGAMRSVLEWIERGTAPRAKHAASLLVAEIRAGAPDAVALGTSFKELQERRHAADYDHLTDFEPIDVADDIDRADLAIDVIDGLPDPARHALAVLILAYGGS